MGFPAAVDPIGSALVIELRALECWGGGDAGIVDGYRGPRGILQARVIAIPHGLGGYAESANAPLSLFETFIREESEGLVLLIINLG